MHTDWLLRAQEDEIFLPSPQVAGNFEREMFCSLSPSPKIVGNGSVKHP